MLDEEGELLGLSVRHDLLELLDQISCRPELAGPCPLWSGLHTPG